MLKKSFFICILTYNAKLISYELQYNISRELESVELRKEDSLRIAELHF
jgi:hypothetical protein